MNLLGIRGHHVVPQHQNQFFRNGALLAHELQSLERLRLSENDASNHDGEDSEDEHDEDNDASDDHNHAGLFGSR